MEAKIADYIARYNEHAHPYNWSTKSVARVMATTEEQLRRVLTDPDLVRRGT